MFELDSLPSPDDPAEALAAVLALRRAADKLERLAVASAIAQGWSWADVAEVLDVSKQAAHKRLAAILPKPPRAD
ncbi:helix-turn-helix domain-containing protein [Rugamonas sp. DEMB1]|uniref:helix-turn-helix domain-containing protein n=1 Tax=Rugamonas sp. DEMB1 TaxID=3039386 RepID=UPI0024475BC1|nr:helix-turn-helix domain-containing protein [Rugamonas sp. DEMB1]WGG51099.1 helix-turn-helix domain containing protein [Rugamonas sp. DEMB1]